MNNETFTIDRSVTRDELKLMLFDWLKEKGILGELQVFLRAKMVEKLHNTSLRPAKKIFSPRDHTLNLIICNYLKQCQLHYTLSVFASECSTSALLDNSLNQPQLKARIYSDLKIENFDKKLGLDFCSSERCALHEMIDAITYTCSKKYESRQCQQPEKLDVDKLLINAQCQTDIPVVSSTKSAQTRMMCSVATQTQKSPTEKDLQDNIIKLEKMLESSQLALKSCQLELQDSRRTIENLVKNRIQLSTEPPSVALDSRIQCSKSDTSNQNQLKNRIQESQLLLVDVENRIKLLDDKFSSVSLKQ